MSYITRRPNPKLSELSRQTASPKYIHVLRYMDADTRAGAGWWGWGVEGLWGDGVGSPSPPYQDGQGNSKMHPWKQMMAVAAASTSQWHVFLAAKMSCRPWQQMSGLGGDGGL